MTEQFENAIEVGEMLLSLNPDRNYDIMKHLGDVYLAGAKYEKAVEIYEKVAMNRYHAFNLNII